MSSQGSIINLGAMSSLSNPLRCEHADTTQVDEAFQAILNQLSLRADEELEGDDNDEEDAELNTTVSSILSRLSSEEGGLDRIDWDNDNNSVNDTFEDLNKVEVVMDSDEDLDSNGSQSSRTMDMSRVKLFSQPSSVNIFDSLRMSKTDIGSPSKNPNTKQQAKFRIRQSQKMNNKNTSDLDYSIFFKDLRADNSSCNDSTERRNIIRKNGCYNCARDDREIINEPPLLTTGNLLESESDGEDSTLDFSQELLLRSPTSSVQNVLQTALQGVQLRKVGQLTPPTPYMQSGITDKKDTSISNEVKITSGLTGRFLDQKKARHNGNGVEQGKNQSNNNLPEGIKNVLMTRRKNRQPRKTSCPKSFLRFSKLVKQITKETFPETCSQLKYRYKALYTLYKAYNGME